MDAISATASIIALLQVSGTVVKYLSGLKDASDEIRRLILEISTLRGLLLAIKEIIAEDSVLLDLLSQHDEGLFGQIEYSLNALATKLGISSKQSGHRLVKVLRWPLQKDDVKETLLLLDRQKALLTLTLQHDQLFVFCSCL